MVINGAISTNRNNEIPIFFKSRIRKFNPPSKTMTDTSKETKGYNISPNTRSTSRIEKIGPAKNPSNNKTIMDGSRVRQAIHCPAIPSSGTSANEMIPEFIIIETSH